MDTMGLFRSSSSKRLLFTCIALCVLMYMLFLAYPCESGPKLYMVPKERTRYVYDSDQRAIPYDEFMPLIFIGGVPRSGTTLMRALLDAHPEIRCGEETRIIPRILGMRTQWERSATEKKRLAEAGITSDIMDSAVQSFILEIIAKHGTAAKHLCNKDPFTLKSTIYLHHIFPNAKFLFMIRDGRAVVNSVISRKVTISGFDLKNPKKCLQRWNQAVDTMYSQCIRVGSSVCMPVYYEQMVLHPEIWMHRILKFLHIPWNESVLHHEDFVGKPGGISLSKTEKSTDQVIKPVNVQALSKWVGQFPEDLVKDMANIAPMLRVLGYDPNANPPDYGTPDPQVKENTLHIKANSNFWKAREKDIFDQNPINQAKAKPKQNIQKNGDIVS